MTMGEGVLSTISQMLYVPNMPLQMYTGLMFLTLQNVNWTETPIVLTNKGKPYLKETPGLSEVMIFCAAD